MLKKLGVYFPIEILISYFFVLLFGVTLVVMPCTAQDIKDIRVYSINGREIPYQTTSVPRTPKLSDPSNDFFFPYDWFAKLNDKIVFAVTFKDEYIRGNDKSPILKVYYPDKASLGLVTLEIQIDSARSAEPSNSEGKTEEKDLGSYIGRNIGMEDMENKVLYFTATVPQQAGRENHNNEKEYRISLRQQRNQSNANYQNQQSPLLIRDDGSGNSKPLLINIDPDSENLANIAYDLRSAEQPALVPKDSGLAGLRVDSIRPKIQQDSQTLRGTLPSGMAPEAKRSHVYDVWVNSKTDAYTRNQVVSGTPALEATFYGAGAEIQGELKFTEAMKVNNRENALEIPSNQVWIVLSGTKTTEATAALNEPEEGMTDLENDLRILTFSYIVPTPDNPRTFSPDIVFLAGSVSQGDMEWSGITDRVGHNLDINPMTMTMLAPIPGDLDNKMAPLSISGIDGHVVDNVAAETTITDLATDSQTGELSVGISFQNVFGDDPSDKFAEFHSDSDTTTFINKFKANSENDFVENGVVRDFVYTGVQMSPEDVKRDDKFFPYYTLYTATILPQGPLVMIKVPAGTVSDIAGNGNKAADLQVTADFGGNKLDKPPSVSRVKSLDQPDPYSQGDRINVEVTLDIDNVRYHGENKPYVTLFIEDSTEKRDATWESATGPKVTFSYIVQKAKGVSKVNLSDSVTLPAGSIIYGLKDTGIANSDYYEVESQATIPFFPDDSQSELDVQSKISNVALKVAENMAEVTVEVTFAIENARFIGPFLYVPLYLGSKDEENRREATWYSEEDVMEEGVKSTKVLFSYAVPLGEDISEVILGDLTLPEDSTIYSATEDAGSYYITPETGSYYRATKEEKISFFAGASDLPEISHVAFAENARDSYTAGDDIDVEVTFAIENARFIGPFPYVNLYLGSKGEENRREATWYSEEVVMEEGVKSTKVTFRVQADKKTSKVILGNNVTLPKDSIIYSATKDESVPPSYYIDPATVSYYKATSQTDIPFFSGETFDSPLRISRPAFPEDAPDRYTAGDNIDVEVTFDIDNARYHGEAPYVTLHLGSRDEENRREATWVPNSEVDVDSTKVTFRYTVEDDDDTSKVFLGNSVTLREGSIIYSAVGSSNAEYRYYIATGGPIELRRPSGQRDANASAVAMDRVIFNELRNAREDKNDWLELKNISDKAVSLKAWQISLVTGQSDEAVVAFPDYTLPPGGILLIVNTDPGATDLARGQNIASAASKGGGVATQYFVAPSLKLPDTPYLLLLRSALDKTGQPEAFEDVLGTYFRAELAYATQVWPLRETAQPENAAVLTPDEAWQRKFEADKVTARGYAAAAWRASGYQAGLGYDAKASERSSLGTPGYPNAALVRQSGTGQISVSELMFSSQGGPHSLPQWIELYNNSSTEAVNLAGWELEVALRTAEGAPRTGGFTFETLHVLPNQTVLLVTYNGRHSGHFPDARVYNLATRHGAELPLNTQRNALLSADGFSLKLSDTDGTLIDAVGNLGSDSAPAWDLPSGKTADGHRISLRRQYENGTRTPRDGRMRASWVSGVRAAAALRTYWGHPQDVGTPGYRSGGPLPVALSAFLPRRTADAVVIKWATQSELDNAGFNLLRSESKTGTFKVINPTLIRGAGTSGERHLYQYTDKSAKPGVVYYYQLEEVSFAGVRETLRTARLRGEVSAGDKLTVIWGDLKKLD